MATVRVELTLYDDHKGRVSHEDCVCNAFISAARNTWNDIHDFQNMRGKLREDSITDYRLLELQRTCDEAVKVIRFSQAEEKTTAADWEWWFGCAGEWFGMRVQAKRLDRSDTPSNEANALGKK